MIAKEMTDIIRTIFETAEEADDPIDMLGLGRIQTFEEAGLLTNDHGLVIDLPDRTQVQLTVVISRIGGLEACPGCGNLPGLGFTPGCDDPDGCGFWQ